jgi:hypothetical protein
MTIAAAKAALDAVQPLLNAASEVSWRDAHDAWDDDYGDDGAVGARAIEEPDIEHSRLWVADLGGGLSVEYRGSEYVGWQAFVDALAQPGVAPHIVQLCISGPDTGANGLKDWDFAALIAATPDFARLAELSIAISDPGDHNQACVRDGQLPTLIAHMPALRTLTLPQAPEPDFFAIDLPRLRAIRTGGDWRTRGFIRHLAEATRLPALTRVDFTDSHAPYLSRTPTQDAEWDSTPFADYDRLFRSPVMERVRALRLRNTRLTGDQYRALQALRPDCQFSIVLAPPHVYVSHWDRTDFPYRHLLPFG